MDECGPWDVRSWWSIEMCMCLAWGDVGGEGGANYAAPVWSTNASESNIGKLQRSE